MDRCRGRVAGTAAAFLATAALAPTLAMADLTAYFNSPPPISTGVAGRVSDISRTHLTSSGVGSYCDTCTIWAGAHYPGGNSLFASWASGLGEACHNYGGENIGAMIEAPWTSQNIVIALAGWTGSSGSNCC